MALPDVLPIRTTDRVTFELRSTTKQVKVAGVLEPVDVYDWFAVTKPGEKLAAIVSPLAYLALRQARAIEDHTARVDKAIELARVEVFYRGAPCGGAEALPELHIYSLGAKIFALSSVGSDPFAEAPAGLPP